MMQRRISINIILATTNPAKIRLFSEAFAQFGLETASPNTKKPVAETGLTPEENALLKAKAAWSPGKTVFADDAGLAIDALGGEPGVQTRRWKGRFSDTVSDQEWLSYLLERMKGVPPEKRTAAFISGWALVNPRGKAGTLRLLTPFAIAQEPIRPMEPGFPLSAVAIRQMDDPQFLVQRVISCLENWPFFQESLALADLGPDQGLN